jgi:opacity protein-like surface antigen
MNKQMIRFSFFLLLSCLFIVLGKQVSAQATLKEIPIQFDLKPAIYFGEGDHTWGVGFGPSFKVGESRNFSHYLGVELSYMASDDQGTVLGYRVDHNQREWLLLFNYTCYTPSLASGHIQPYLSMGLGNLFVQYKANSPVLGKLVDDNDTVNPTFAFGLGTEFLINEHVGLGLGYRFLSSFNVRMDNVSDNLYQHGLQFGANVAF